MVGSEAAEALAMESVWSASAAGRAASRAEGDDYDNDEHRALFHPAFRMTARPAADAASDDRDVAAAAERPSKTKRKAESHDLQALGESLLELGDDHLASLGLDETLVEAIRAARKMRSHEARRRQLQLIGKLMRSADVELARGADRVDERLVEAERREVIVAELEQRLAERLQLVRLGLALRLAPALGCGAIAPVGSGVRGGACGHRERQRGKDGGCSSLS